MENLKNEFITSFDDKHESSEVSSIIPLTPTSTIEPSFIPPQPSHSTITSSTDSSFISPFPNIINFNNSSSNIKNDNSANTANITSGKTTIQLNPRMDDNTNVEDSSENLNLSLQQEEGIDANTVITNVIDGNGEDVPFDGYIYSSNITFEFLGLKDGVETDEVDGFECRLDEEDFKECESGISYSVSPVPHRFEVRSYSYVGESFDKIHDPTPATWKWDVGNGMTQTICHVDANGGEHTQSP